MQKKIILFAKIPNRIAGVDHSICKEQSEKKKIAREGLQWKTVQEEKTLSIIRVL